MLFALAAAAALTQSPTPADVCDLESRPVTLAELTTFVSKCIQRYQIQPGQRLVVHQWSYTAGNQPDPRHPTLRAALDAVIICIWRSPMPG